MKSQLKKKVNQPDINNIDAAESGYLYISPSKIPNAGNGLYTSIRIYKDEIIARFKGELLSAKQFELRTKKGNDKYFINMPDGSTMDSMQTKCYAKYANDAQGFLKSDFKNNSKIALDESGNVCLTAMRSIKAGEEIFCSYGKKYWAHQKAIRITER